MSLNYFRLTVDAVGGVTIPDSLFAPGVLVDVYIVDAAVVDRQALMERWKALAEDVSKPPAAATETESNAPRGGD